MSGSNVFTNISGRIIRLDVKKNNSVLANYSLTGASFTNINQIDLNGGILSVPNSNINPNISLSITQCYVRTLRYIGA